MGVGLPPIFASIQTVDYKNLQNVRLEDGFMGEERICREFIVTS